MSKHLKRILALLLALVMVIGLLPTVAFAAESKDVWSQILDYEATHIKKNRSTGKVSADDYAAIAGDVAEIVVNSDDYKPGTCTYDPDSGNAVFFWEDANGEPQGYSPALRAKIENGSNGTDLDSIGETVTKSFAKKGGAPSSNNVYVIGPWYGSDESFTDQYKAEGQHVASALGTTYTLYSGSNATIANVANAMSNGGVVFFDSHGDTDYYSNTDENDFVTRANTSYLTLTTGTGLTTTDKTRVQGTYAKYYPAYSFTSTDGDTVWCVNGDVIARHMNSNAPHSLLWMAICLGMATDGLQKPLRNKGVEVAYGYSQSVSFGGDYLWEETFWNNMVSGKTVAQSISAMKTAYGEWDYSKKICNTNHWSNSWIASTITDARNDYCAFPIVVSSEDTYPGHGNVDALQTVNSTYTLYTQEEPDPCTITLKAGTTTWRTVNTYTNTTATLPAYTGTVPTGYTFAGWTASAISGTTQSAPTLYNGSYATGSSTAVTLYACFSKSESGGGSSAPGYYLATSVPEVGDKIIIALKSGDKYYALPNGKLSAAVASLAGAELTVSGNKATATSDNTFNVYADTNGNVGLQSTANDTAFLAFNSGKLHCNGWGDTKYCSFSAEGNGLFLITAVSNDRALGVSGTGFTCTSSRSSASPVYIFAYTEGGSSSTTTYTTTLTVCSHTYQETDRLDATCTDAGTIEYTCSKCGDRYYDDIPALGHDYGAWTSNNNGKHSKTCRRTGCGDVVTENCSYTSTTSGATTTFTCSVCNYSYSTVLDTYTVSYNVLGSVVNTASCVEGSTVTLPTTATSVDGFTFAGWVKNAIGTETATAPTVLTGPYKPTANTTLYALYTRTEAGSGTGSGDYEKVTSTSGLTNGQYLVVYEDGNVAFNGALSTLDAISNTISVTISNNKIASNSTTDAVAFTFNSSDGSFKGTGSKYFGFAKDDNGLTSSSTALSNTVSIDSDGDAVIKSSGGSYLRYNKSSGQTRFRYYKSSTYTGQQPIQLYKKGAGSSSTTYYTTAPVYVAPCEHANTHVVNAADATCTAAGYTGDTVCDDCGTTVTTGTAIAALGHNYGAFTSNNNGFHSKTCSRCSHKVTENCSYTTSTSGTTVTHTCSVCNYSYTSELNTFDVTYSVPAGVSAIAKATVIEGESITLPQAGAVEGYTFAGWVKAAIATETETAPTILTGSYKPTADVTLYALYTRIEAGTGSGAVPSAAFAPGDTGDYVIAAQKDGTWYALPNAPTLPSGKIEGEVITVSDNNGIKYVTTANAEGYVWTVAKSGSYYTISDGSKSLYHSNGGASGTNLSYGTNANYPWSIYTSSGNILLAGVVKSTNTVGSRGILCRVDGETPIFGGYSLGNVSGTDYTNVILLPVSGGSGDTTYYTTAPVVEEECTHENTTLTGAVAATCEAAGYTGDYVCDDCGTTVTTGTAIAALGHDLVAGAIITPTCTTAGYTEYNCSRCDYSENKDEVEALGHDLRWDGVVGNGISHNLACARCDYTESEACTIVGGSCSVCGYVAKTAEIGDYARVTAALDDWSGTYLIVYEGSSYAFNGSLSTPNAAANYNTVSIVDGVVVGDDTVDAYAVTIEKIEGTDYYTIKLGSGKYMGNTGTSTGINASTTKYQNAISLDGDGNAIIANTSGTNTYNIRFNSGSSSNRFAFYGTSTGYAVKLYRRVECDHNWGTGVITTPATCTAEGVMTYTCSICLEAKTEAIPMAAHTPAAYPEAAASCTEPGSTGGTYCSVCKTELTAATVIPALGHDLSWDGNVGNGTNHVLACSRCEYTENEACNMVEGTCTVCGYSEAAEVVVKISSAALRLGENIDLIYTASVPEDATNVYMTFTMNGETVTVEDDGTHIFAFTAINPQCMGDNVAAILYATVSGTEYTDEIATYSVRQYCINKLADSSVTGTLRTLISDVLAYGAAAQTYMNYNTSALVNSGSDVKNPTYSTFTSLSGLNATFTGTAAESPCWIGASLDLSNNVAMVFRFASPNKTGLSVKVTYNGKTTTFSGTSITAVSGMSGVYEVKLTGIKATDFDETVSASFYKSSAQVGNMVSYSVNTYICAKQADNDANLAALVKALYNYGTSAKAYRPA